MTWLIDFIKIGGTELKTRDGRTAKQVTHFPDLSGEWTAVAVLNGDLVTYSIRGEFIDCEEEHPLDLMPPIKRYWHCYSDKANKGNYLHGSMLEIKNTAYRYADPVQIIPVPKEGK